MAGPGIADAGDIRTSERDRNGPPVSSRPSPRWWLRWVLLRDRHGRQAPQALLRTHPHGPPATLLAWDLKRWQVEVTFQEVRTHLDMARTTPDCLL